MPDGLPLPAKTGEAASAYQTISVILTQTAAVTLQPQATLTPQVTPQPSSTLQPVEPSLSVALTNTPVPSSSLAPPCDIAVAGNPIDVSIPDDTKLVPGESFVKTWRLVNAGTCVWSREYGLVFFSGFDMGFRREDLFRREVNPGESIEISLDMVAPREPGSYQGNYKLRGKSNQLFGIGPEGGSPFWVRIVVVAQETATPTPAPPSPTPTVAVLISGSVILQNEQPYDLDAASPGSGAGEDFVLRLNGESTEWVSLNGARVLAVGAVEPGVEVCKTAVMSAEPLVLGVELEGSYLCVRTDRGLPARVYLADFDPAVPSLDLQFVVWSVP
jgi:hypothetical protein